MYQTNAAQSSPIWDQWKIPGSTGWETPGCIQNSKGQKLENWKEFPLFPPEFDVEVVDNVAYEMFVSSERGEKMPFFIRKSSSPGSVTFAFFGGGLEFNGTRYAIYFDENNNIYLFSGGGFGSLESVLKRFHDQYEPLNIQEVLNRIRDDKN